MLDDHDATVVQFAEGPPEGLADTPLPQVAAARDGAGYPGYPEYHGNPKDQGSHGPQYIAQQTSFDEYTPGLNPLVNAAAFLLMELDGVRKGRVEELEELRNRLEAEIQSFSNQAQALGVRNDTLTAARYLLCTALDESVTSSPIPGAASDWAERSLLSTFHNETHGGEVFFQVLDRVMQQPAANLYLLELIFLLLSFGFEGKYRLQDRGPLAIEAMRDSLYRQIRLLRGEPGQDLSRKIEPASFKNKTYAYVPLWLVATVVAVCLSVTFWGFSFALGRKAEPLLAQFSSHAPSATPLAGPASVPASTTTAPDGDSPAHSETLP